MVDPIPAGYHSVTPYLMVRDAARAIAFYRDAFGATETMRFDDPGGRIAHAEIRIGDSHVMLADENPDFAGPQTLGGTGVSLMLYVEDVDATFAKAVAAGATVSLWLTGEAVWFAVPGRAEAFELPHAAPLADLLTGPSDGGRLLR